MSNNTFAPIPSREREVREGIGTGIAFIALFALHRLILRPPLPQTTLFLYATLTLALAGVYVLSGFFHTTQQMARGGKIALLPVFLLGNGLILAIALALWGRTLIYFGLFALNNYGALVYYTGKRRWALAFAGGAVAFAWLVYALQKGWLAAGPALLGDLPWYGLTFALAEIVARQREHREQAERMATELAGANRQLQNYVAQAEELAIARERARLAGEIHDSVGHTLTALHFQLELLARLPPDQQEQRQQVVEQCRRLAKDGLSEARRAVQALGPAVLESFSLPEAISRLVTRFDQGLPGTTKWQVIGKERPLAPRLTLPLYRAAQEALSNIQHHAPTTPQVTVHLRFEPHEATLTVENAPPAIPGEKAGPEEGEGHGLAGLRVRAEAAGGTFHAGPTSSGGFRVLISLPVR